MIQKDLVYNPKKDKKAVEPFGYVDLVKASAERLVPATMADADLSYNGVENPESVFDKPRDVFESAHLSRTVRDYKPSQKTDTPTGSSDA